METTFRFSNICFAYDCILKQQRKNVVNINSPDFYKIVYDGIRNLFCM